MGDSAAKLENLHAFKEENLLSRGDWGLHYYGNACPAPFQGNAEGFGTYSFIPFNAGSWDPLEVQALIPANRYYGLTFDVHAYIPKLPWTLGELLGSRWRLLKHWECPVVEVVGLVDMPNSRAGGKWLQVTHLADPLFFAGRAQMGEYSNCDGPRYILQSAVRVDGISLEAEYRWEKYDIACRYRWLAKLKENSRTNKQQIATISRALAEREFRLVHPAEDTKELPPSTSLVQLPLF